MKVWITKYALTSSGIYDEEVKQCDNFPSSVKGIRHTFMRGEWWHTKEEAITEACRMRDTKIKQLEKLKNLKFEL